MSDLTYSEIVDMLKDYAEDVAFDCLVNGKRQGPRIYGDCNGKASVVVSGNMKGLVGFWQGQRPGHDGGNLLHLIEIARGMSTHGEAVRYAKHRYLGIADRAFTDQEKRAWAKKREEMERRRAAEDAAAEAKRRAREGDVKILWQECRQLSGTPAQAYLDRRVEYHDWPISLKFHPAMMCELTKRRHPCLVAGVQAVDSRLIALWRIFLNDDGTNLMVDGEKVKMGFGPASGGMVRLSPTTETLNIGEGLESTLGAMALSGYRGSWAASLSTSGMRGVILPEKVRTAHIWTDGDWPRFKKLGEGTIEPGNDAGKALAERLRAEGRTAVIHEPHTNKCDWLDIWQNSRTDNWEGADVTYT